ncbi:SMI1/KNR4 family protein [Streptomyces sp. NPDC006334]|uniref:SMI1/KNR4 family protein n=1 Tax=Streptomyces sp. NPDC006334 TaxID=3156754 RepID=UPI0033A76342
MSDEPFDWQEFLGRWRAEWVPDLDEELEDDEDEDHGPSGDPLGRPGADEAAITAAEERLGRRLPPSYREFLAVSDGWRVNETAGVHRLGGVADIDWFQDPHGMAPLYEQELGDDPREEDVLLAGMWRRALRLETDSDMSNALLDPGDSDEDGEWALYVHKGWSGELPERYPSFRAYMEDMYRGFHSDRAQSADFVNATTCAQDARVEEARLLALRGRFEEALPLLEEAMSFGRPHSRVLLNQLRHLSNPRVPQDYGTLVADPRYLTEILPVQAMEASAHRGRLGEEDHWLGMMAARGVDRHTAGTTLRTMVDGTYRYAPGGAWGRAVAEAREPARWGATDTAWRALRDALPLWETPGPSLIAPIGLLADPVLGPLVTPERGREVLATPRSGETGPAPEPVPDLDPPGLAWLTEPTANRQPFQGYRCVWVEGVAPDRLPALIGEEGAELSAPTDPHMMSWHAPRPHEREGVQPWEDRAVVAVGRTAEAWSFAFDGHCDRHLNRRFLSPARAASSSGRAVVVWRDPRASSPGGPPASFHLSVAEGGEELYAFTVRGTEIRRSGAIPDALDPANWCCSGDAELAWEADMLAALHSELGLSLPRFALTRGRLSTFTTRSWTRAPQAGESFAYATIGFVRHRP